MASEYELTNGQINRMIERAERALKCLKLTVGAAVEVSPGVDLVFAKFDNAWRLMRYTEAGGQPLINASRMFRLQALKLLPKLEERLIEEAALQLSDAELVVHAAAEYVAGLEAWSKSQ